METIFRHVLVLLLAALLPMPLLADAAIVDGIAYRLDGDVAIVTARDGYCGVVEIPDTVTILGRSFPVVGIDDRAFYDCDRIYSVFMPDSLRFIGEAAFAHCDSIISLTVPDRVEVIPDSAFAHCPNLEVTILGRGVTRIGHGALWHAGDALLSNPRLVLLSDTPPEVDAELVEYMVMDSPFCYDLFIYAYDQIQGSNWQPFAEHGRNLGQTTGRPLLGWKSTAYRADRDYLDRTVGSDWYREHAYDSSGYTDWINYPESKSNSRTNGYLKVSVMPRYEVYVSGTTPLVRGEYFASICTNNNAFGKAKQPVYYAEYYDRTLAIGGQHHLYHSTGNADSARFVVIFKNYYYILHDMHAVPSSDGRTEPAKLYYYQNFFYDVQWLYTESVLKDTLRLTEGERTNIFYKSPGLPYNCAATSDNRDVLDVKNYRGNSYYRAICALGGLKSGVAHLYLYPLNSAWPMRTITVIVGDGESGVEQVGSPPMWQAAGGAGCLTLLGLSAGQGVEVYNLEGRAVRRFVASDSEASIDGLQPGVYIARHQGLSTKVIIH